MATSRSKLEAEKLPKESYVFILASLVNSVGSALMWPLTTIYVHNVLHRSYGAAGLALLFQSLASIVGQMVGGALYAKVGAKRLIIWSLVLTSLAQFSLLIAKAWVPYITSMTINAFLIAVTMPAVNAFIGFRWPEARARLFNAVYVSNNVGVAIGTTLAGILASISFALTFLFNGLTTLLFAIFFAVFLKRVNMEDLRQWSGGLAATRQASARQLLKQYRLYFFVGLGSMMVFLATSAWNSGVAPYLNQAGHPPSTYSFLWTVNGIVILIGQPLTSFLNRTRLQSLSSRLTASALFYACAFALIWIWHGPYVVLMIGMVIATLGEMLLSPTIPALITKTTGSSAAFYLGISGGMGSIGRLIGPVLFGNLFDYAGLPPILLVATAAALVGTASFVAQQRIGEREA